MNTIYKVPQKPYILDPFPLGHKANKGYTFPIITEDLGNKNNKVNFTANNPFTKKTNKTLQRQTEKLNNLQAELKKQTQHGQQLNTLA